MIRSLTGMNTIITTFESIEDFPGCMDGNMSQLVDNYWDALQFMQSLNSVRKFVAHTGVGLVQGWLPDHFRTDIHKSVQIVASHTKTGILENARTFQKRVVSTWYKHASKRSELLILEYKYCYQPETKQQNASLPQMIHQ